MTTLSDLMVAHGRSTEADIDWLHLLVADGQLIADLAFADIVLWVPTTDGSFIAVAHSRPSSAATLFYRDFVGQEIKPEWKRQVTEAFETAQIVDTAAPDWYEETPTRVRAVPVLRRLAANGAEVTSTPIAVLTRHTQPQRGAHPQPPGAHLQPVRQRPVRDDRVRRLPRPRRAQRPPPRSAPRIRRTRSASTSTASSRSRAPTASRAFNRMGFDGELEGESLAEVTTELLRGKIVIDESLPLVVTGRAPWRTDIEARGVTVTLRTIPIRHQRRAGRRDRARAATSPRCGTRSRSSSPRTRRSARSTTG